MIASGLPFAQARFPRILARCQSTCRRSQLAGIKCFTRPSKLLSVCSRIKKNAKKNEQARHAKISQDNPRHPYTCQGWLELSFWNISWLKKCSAALYLLPLFLIRIRVKCDVIIRNSSLIFYLEGYFWGWFSEKFLCSGFCGYLVTSWSLCTYIVPART